ncbi:CMRF35-like molecule 6 isoform X2 [Ochotona princeps]|uniref:CMRF35-like molecule 6 isoform X2 n=1 Tax=Ochotona princeps TaxID=9978 RepID=UPI0027150FC2|nr:CMRF35-like molecule 6 isoform X2 [Ochotona princeps]
MRPRSVWLPSALFLLHVQGCFSLSCPSVVAGTVGGSLSVQCQYEEKYKNHRKFWCFHPCLPNLYIMRTKASVGEVRSGRVSIRDHPANLSFTVTLEELRLQDAGTYQCGIDVMWSLDTTFLVEVRVSPDPTQSSSTLKTKDTLVPVTTLLPELTLPVHTRPSPPPRSQLSSIHSLKLLLLLAFLKLPLLLGTLGAVLWMKNRLQGAH